MAETIEIQGMSCEGCEVTIEEALASINGVTSVQVDRDTDSATVEGEANRDELVKAVTEAGYEVARN